MKRLMSCRTVSEKNWSGVYKRYPKRPLSLLPGPPNPLERSPVVLLSVCGRRWLLEMKPVLTATSRFWFRVA